MTNREIKVSQRAIEPLHQRLQDQAMGPQTPIEARLELAHALLINRFPSLRQVEWIRDTSNLPKDFHGAAAWLRPSDEHPRSAVVLNPAERLASIVKQFEFFPTTFGIIAQRIGIPFEELRKHPEVYVVFALFHEMGHARRFFGRHLRRNSFENAVKNDSGETTGELATLPAGGIPPSQLRDIAERYFRKHSQRLAEMGIDSPRNLMIAQETAYRNMESERAADKFAVEALQMFWDYLGFPYLN